MALFRTTNAATSPRAVVINLTTEAFERAADAAEDPKDRAAAKRYLERMRERFLREGDAERVRWVASIPDRLGANYPGSS